MRPLPPSALFVAALAISTSCASTPLPRPPLDADFAAALTAAEFAGAEAMLTGIEPLAAGGDRAWRTGDEVLLGVRLDDHGETTRWLLHLRVRDPDVLSPDGSKRVQHWLAGGPGWAKEFVSGTAAIDVILADAHGSQVGASMVEVAREILANGFVAACTQQGMDPASPDFDQEPRTIAYFALRSMLEIVRQDPTLRSILFRVLDKPSLLSILWHLGAKVSIHSRFADCVRLDATPSPLPAGEPAWLVPVDLEINDRPALYCHLLVGNPAPPFHLCGGILGVDATRPSDPELRFRLVLLGARRGGD